VNYISDIEKSSKIVFLQTTVKDVYNAIGSSFIAQPFYPTGKGYLHSQPL